MTRVLSLRLVLSVLYFGVCNQMSVTWLHFTLGVRIPVCVPLVICVAQVFIAF